MQLKYLKGKEITFHMGHPIQKYRFAPIGEIPEDFGRHILKTRPNDFEIFIEHPIVEPEIKEEDTVDVVEKEKFKCDLCEYETASKARLSAHKRFKHKEN